MTSGPPDAQREQAREWGRRLLSAAPWSDVADRVTLLLVEPPAGLYGAPAPTISFWLTLDQEAARSLPPEYRQPLTTNRAHIEHPRVPELPPVTLSITTDDAMHRLLQGVTRSAMEARWLVRHVDIVSDRLRRGEQYALRANLIPDDAPERTVRGFWVDAVAAARALDVLPVDAAAGLTAAGEVVGALCRLACFDHGGSYPPSPYLRAVARETRLGKRINPWLDDLAKAVSGDDVAARRVLGSRDQVIEEASTVLGERYRNRPWLRDPDAFALQPPR